MSYARISFVSAAAACLLSFATSASTQTVSLDVGRTPGCGRCNVSYLTEGTLGVPPIVPQFEAVVPLGAAGLAPETGAASPTAVEKPHKKVWRVASHHNRHALRQ